MDLFLGLGLLLLFLLVVVGRPLAALGQTAPLLALVLAVGAILLPLVNLARCRRAPWGLLAVGLGLAGYGGAWLARLPVQVAAGLLAAPNAVFLLVDQALVPLLRRRAARVAAAAVRSAGGPREVRPYLVHPDPGVRELAVASLAAAGAEEGVAAAREALAAPEGERAGVWALLRRVAGEPAGAATARALLAEAAGREDVALAAAAARELGGLPGEEGDGPAAARDPRPEVRLGYLRGRLAAKERGDAPRGLVGLLADPEVPEALRAEALEAVDEAGGALAPDELREAARARLAAGPPTPELLWLLAERGAPDDAPLAALHVASDAGYATANAALEAVAGILDRAGDLGPHAAPTLEALRAGRARLREVHPPGDNRLADGLVAALEELEAQVGASAADGGG